MHNALHTPQPHIQSNVCIKCKLYLEALERVQPQAMKTSHEYNVVDVIIITAWLLFKGSNLMR